MTELIARHLHNDSPGHDKVYNLYLIEDESIDHVDTTEYRIEVEWGKRGSVLKREVKMAAYSQSFVELEFDKLVASKLKKGYHVVAPFIRSESPTPLPRTKKTKKTKEVEKLEEPNPLGIPERRLDFDL